MQAVAVARSAAGNHAAERSGAPKPKKPAASPLSTIETSASSKLSGRQRSAFEERSAPAEISTGRRSPKRSARSCVSGIDSTFEMLAMFSTHATCRLSQP